MTRLMVTGATGHLGRQVAARAAAAGWAVTGTYVRQPGEHADEQLDIRDAGAVHKALERVRPAVVVHAAAGRDRNDWPANAHGAAHVAVACAAAGVRLVHVSSDA